MCYTHTYIHSDAKATQPSAFDVAANNLTDLYLKGKVPFALFNQALAKIEADRKVEADRKLDSNM